MNKLKMLFCTIILIACTSTAFAWPACSGSWTQVPKGTSHAGGTIYITGDNLTFQCQQSKPPTPPSNISNTNQNTNITKSDAKSASSSNAVAKQDQKQSQDQGQTQSSDSVAVAAASNNSNGNNSNNSTFNQVRQTPMAYSPDVLSTMNCFKGMSAGASTPFFGASLGGGKVDKNCQALATSAYFFSIGAREAGCKIAVRLQYAKDAGITLADCLGPAPVPVPVAEAVSAPVVPVTVVPETPAVIDPPVTITPSLLAECDLVSNTISNICKAKLDSAVIFFRNAGEGHLIIEVDAVTGKHRAENIVDYLAVSGVERSAIRTQYVPGSNRGARVTFISN